MTKITPGRDRVPKFGQTKKTTQVFQVHVYLGNF